MRLDARQAKAEAVHYGIKHVHITQSRKLDYTRNIGTGISHLTK